MHRLLGRCAALEVVEFHVERHVPDEFGQVPVDQHLRQRLAKGVTGLAPNVPDVIDQAVERAVLADPLRRGLLAHTRDAGEVVTRVASQRGEVGILGRGQAVLLLHRLRGHSGEVRHALARIEHGRRGRHELERIPVPGDDRRLHARALRHSRESGNEVVGFESLALEIADAHRREHVTDEIDLTSEFFGGLGARRLVALERLTAEGRSRHVEGDRDVRRVEIAQRIDEHGREAVDGVRRLARHRGEVLDRQGVEGAVGKGVPVEQKEPTRRHPAILGASGLG